MKNILKITIIVIILLVVVQQLISRNATNKTESKDYEVLHRLGPVEIRAYPAMVLASASMESGSMFDGQGNGFRTVASYIFGGNSDNQKISMTSPVMVEPGDSATMSFIMPSGYTLQNLPDPENPAVVLQEKAGMTVAAIRYGGFNNQSKFEDYKKLLESNLSENNIQSTGNYMFFGYNPPYELVNRRNEVVVEVDWIATP